jgi:succinyl-CoA synthetase beta subunit
MKLFEFEAKNILKQYGILVPQGDVADNADEAEAIAGEIGKSVVLKSQVLVSGRGKSGGIIFANNATEVKTMASDLLGSAIKGNVVTSLLVEEQLDMVEQFYASIAIDRQARRYVVLASTSGGVDIEEIARDFPDRISRDWVNPAVGFSEREAIALVSQLNISQDDAARFAAVMGILYKAAMDYDAELAEINPLGRTPSGKRIEAQ